MKNIELAFKKYTHMDKIRKARFVNLAIKSNIDDIKKHDTTLNTIISLLAKGDMNCAGGPIHPTTGTDLFGHTTTTTPPHQATNGEGGTQPHTGGDNGGNNTQPTPPPAPEPTHDPEPTPAPEKSGFFSKLAKKIKGFGGKILEAEE